MCKTLVSVSQWPSHVCVCMHTNEMFNTGEREGGRERGREGEREREREGKREGGKEGGREGEAL